MKCSEVQENLLFYLKKEGDLSFFADIEEHLKHCQDCQKEFFFLKSSWNLLSEAKEISPYPSFHSRLMERVAREEKKNVYRFKYLLSAAAALLLFLGLWFLYDLNRSASLENRSHTAKKEESELKHLGIDRREESEIVRNLEFLENLPLLKKKELLENLKVINEVIPEEHLSDEE